ncbi:Nif3-like dinuclear metal center hexameric protein [Auraticoccus monumenti]|uniref:GTP cyclohydrolase 1 type 2 homolog n=1 Tax=Auraticoccus monumenti TaxID=675864 RepID=A0A1G7EVB3_9ACTN|nr:Nif3-like dinuclear metal center hexameric protein [Auraticoccus monumenti]SDE67436.1 dinuclear metal center protein, YbgI/SA1388 family [Auraticoccus monumenti]
MGTVTVGDVVDVVERHYPPATAEPWDAVGLAVGERSAPVDRVLLTVDVVPEVLTEARERGAQLVVAHHPLLLRGLTSVVAEEPKGRLVLAAARDRVAVLTAHTNADVAVDGVSQALADALGLVGCRPLVPHGDDPVTGTGRVGRLPEPMTAAELVEHVAARVPATATGVRLAGDPARRISTVALVGGAGDGYLDAARASGADAYLTSDLRHHPVSEFLQHEGAPVLLDVAHAAAEATWLPVLARVLADGLGPDGPEVLLSDVRTDPWTLRSGAR